MCCRYPSCQSPGAQATILLSLLSMVAGPGLLSTKVHSYPHCVSSANEVKSQLWLEWRRMTSLELTTSFLTRLSSLDFLLSFSCSLPVELACTRCHTANAIGSVAGSSSVKAQREKVLSKHLPQTQVHHKVHRKNFHCPRMMMRAGGLLFVMRVYGSMDTSVFVWQPTH